MVIKKIYYRRYTYFPRLFKRSGFKVGAEIGVAKGYFSKHLLRFVPGLLLFSIDAWKLFSGCRLGETQQMMDKLYERAKQRLYPYNCAIIREWSNQAVKYFADGSLDFVYIDAAHDYDSVMEDLTLWSKKVRKGGIVAGDDFVDPHGKDYPKDIYDVKQAVLDFCKQKKVSTLYTLVKDNDRSWYYEN